MNPPTATKPTTAANPLDVLIAKNLHRAKSPALRAWLEKLLAAGAPPINPPANGHRR